MVTLQTLLRDSTAEMERMSNFVNLILLGILRNILGCVSTEFHRRPGKPDVGLSLDTG